MLPSAAPSCAGCDFAEITSHSWPLLPMTHRLSGCFAGENNVTGSTTAADLDRLVRIVPFYLLARQRHVHIHNGSLGLHLCQQCGRWPRLTPTFPPFLSISLYSLRLSPSHTHTQTNTQPLSHTWTKMPATCTLCKPNVVNSLRQLAGRD